MRRYQTPHAPRARGGRGDHRPARGDRPGGRPTDARTGPAGRGGRAPRTRPPATAMAMPARPRSAAGPGRCRSARPGSPISRPTSRPSPRRSCRGDATSPPRPSACSLRLDLEGLSSGDFEPALRELLGEQAPLSASTIIRLKDTWAADDRAWRERPITDRSAYIWADVVDLGAGLESGARAGPGPGERALPCGDADAGAGRHPAGAQWVVPSACGSRVRAMTPVPFRAANLGPSAPAFPRAFGLQVGLDPSPQVIGLSLTRHPLCPYYVTYATFVASRRPPPRS